MAEYQVLYWKHVPAQIKVFEPGKKAIARQMPARFHVEIDRIAMVEGLTGSDDYLNQWHWTPKTERPGTSEEVAESLIHELEEQFDQGQQT